MKYGFKLVNVSEVEAHLIWCHKALPFGTSSLYSNNFDNLRRLQFWNTGCSTGRCSFSLGRRSH